MPPVHCGADSVLLKTIGERRRRKPPRALRVPLREVRIGITLRLAFNFGKSTSIGKSWIVLQFTGEGDERNRDLRGKKNQ